MIKNKTRKTTLILPGSKDWVEPGETVDGRKIEDTISKQRVFSSIMEKPPSTPKSTTQSDFVLYAGPDAEIHERPLRTTLEKTDEKHVGENWLARVQDGSIPPIGKTKGEPIQLLANNPYADRALFMICPVGEHLFARAIGTKSKGDYVSNLLHGIRAKDDMIRWDDRPLFDDNVSREDPRASRIEGKIYMTYTRLDPKDKGKFNVGLAVMEDPRHPDKVRELGSIIDIGDDGVDSKDAAIFQGNDKVNMLVRLKPGIQVVSFNSMDELVDTLCTSPKKRNAYWETMRADYQSHPGKYNHLHDNTPGMAEWRAKWKALFHNKAEKLVKNFRDSEFYKLDFSKPYWFGTGNPPLPVEHEGKKYLLGFHHWGQVIGELTEEGVKKKKMDGERVDSLKLYGVVATLHHYDDPTKIRAVSPIPVSMPDLAKEEERGLTVDRHPLTHKDAVHFVNIASGAGIDNKGDEQRVNLYIGVNDVYTIPESIRLKELLKWMLKYGEYKE